MLLTNAFSLSMLQFPPEGRLVLAVHNITREVAQALLAAEPLTVATGSQEAAEILSRDLGREVPYAPSKLHLGVGTRLVVGSPHAVGPTSGKVRYFAVEVEEDGEATP